VWNSNEYGDYLLAFVLALNNPIVLWEQQGNAIIMNTRIQSIGFKAKEELTEFVTAMIYLSHGSAALLKIQPNMYCKHFKIQIQKIKL
jgi:hypothetical protein